MSRLDDELSVSSVFFFKQKTAYEMRISDWSSDVCSSDLAGFRNADLPANPFDNATGQADQAKTTNSASGVAVTADYAFNENIGAKLIFSDRHSDRKSTRLNSSH